jgi:hypothetical protein
MFHKRGGKLQSACKGCKRHRDRTRYAVAGDSKRHANRRWKRANPERVREMDRDWKRRNPGVKAADNAQRRQRERLHRPRWLNTSAVRRIYRLAAALRRMGVDVHVDHWVPLKAEHACGLHVQDNLAIVDGRENVLKGARIVPQGPPPAIAKTCSVSAALLHG